MSIANPFSGIDQKTVLNSSFGEKLIRTFTVFSGYGSLGFFSALTSRTRIGSANTKYFGIFDYGLLFLDTLLGYATVGLGTALAGIMSATRGRGLFGAFIIALFSIDVILLALAAATIVGSVLMTGVKFLLSGVFTLASLLFVAATHLVTSIMNLVKNKKKKPAPVPGPAPGAKVDIDSPKLIKLVKPSFNNSDLHLNTTHQSTTPKSVRRKLSFGDPDDKIVSPKNSRSNSPSPRNSNNTSVDAQSNNTILVQSYLQHEQNVFANLMDHFIAQTPASSVNQSTQPTTSPSKPPEYTPSEPAQHVFYPGQ